MAHSIAMSYTKGLNLFKFLSHILGSMVHACMLSRLVMYNFLQPHELQPHQALQSMEFSRQEYWSGLPFPPPGNLHNPGIQLTSPASLALAGRFFATAEPGKPWGAWYYVYFADKEAEMRRRENRACFQSPGEQQTGQGCESMADSFWSPCRKHLERFQVHVQN